MDDFNFPTVGFFWVLFVVVAVVGGVNMELVLIGFLILLTLLVGVEVVVVAP